MNGEPKGRRKRKPERLGAELGIVLFFLLCWLAFFAFAILGYPLAGAVRLQLFHLYGLAASGGWIMGNLEVARRRRQRKRRSGLLLMHLFLPCGLFYLLWALAPEEMRRGFPLAPLYALGVFVILFLVPISLRRVFEPRA